MARSPPAAISTEFQSWLNQSLTTQTLETELERYNTLRKFCQIVVYEWANSMECLNIHTLSQIYQCHNLHYIQSILLIISQLISLDSTT